MKIPKIFGNKVVILVIAVILILIVLVSFLNIGEIAFTGFAGQNQKKDNQNTQTNQAPPVNSNSEKNNKDSALLITVLPTGSEILTNLPSDNNSTNSTNTSSDTTRTSRRGGHGGGGGSDGGSVNPNPDNNTNPNPQINLKRKLTKKPRNLKLKIGNIDINEGEEFEGMVRLKLDNDYDQTIAAFDINFTKDIDLSDIIANTDFTSGKSFLHHSYDDSLENIDLYVPVTDGIDTIVVCPGASGYDEIYYGCANQEIFYLNETNPRIELNLDGLYYIIHGITGTGAVGVNVTNISSSRQNATPPGNLSAFAGNITEISMPGGEGTTQAWAGYYGNVSGTIQLADGSNNVLYNWSLASPEGEVFASTNNSIVWNHIQCFNFTSSGNYISDEAGNGGATNLYGTNLTQLENQYGVRSTDIDGVDETFYLLGGGTHNIFYVNSNQFDEGECQNTRIFDSSGGGVDNNFEEVLLYEPTTSSVIFGSLLNEDVPGFDNKQHDFEMLVLENGHLTDINTTTYYFYAVMF
jgi:hypothetical protein